MELLELYKSILESIGSSVDEKGLVSIVGESQNTPNEIGDKRLVLPTSDILRAGDWRHCIAFHPMSENILRGESVVIKNLRLLMNLRLTTTAVKLASQLLGIAANTAYHGKLTPKQSEFLSAVPDASEKTVRLFDKVIQKLIIDGEYRLVSIYLKRGGTWHGSKRSRVAVVSFPIMDEFEKDERNIFGVTMSGKEKETILNLINFIFPNGNDLEEYSYGSDSQCAPYFHALLKAYVNVADRLNSITKKFKAHLDDVDELMIKTDWAAAADDLAKYRDIIPTLAGNDGESEQKVEPTVNPVSAMRQAALQAAANVSGTIAPPPPPAAKPQVIAPVATLPTPTGYGLLNPTPQPVAPRVNSNGAIDFNSIVAGNPMLQQQQMMMQMPMQQPGSGGYNGYVRGQNPNQPQWPPQMMPMQNNAWLPQPQQSFVQQNQWAPQPMQNTAMYGGV